MSPSIAASKRHRAGATLAILLITAAALVVAGILVEGQAESGVQHSVGETHAEHHEGHHDKSAIGGHSEVERPAEEAGAEVVEHRSGVGVESPWVVALGTLAAAALAFAVWRRPSRPVLVIVVAFTTAAGLLDLFELNHQAAEGCMGLVLLAAVIVTVRVATAVGCGYLYRTASIAA
jgi:hypothetical protein